MGVSLQLHASTDFRLIRASGRLRLWGCQAAEHASCNVDAASFADSECDRLHPVLHHARTPDVGMSKLRKTCPRELCLLSSLRKKPSPLLSAVSASSGAGLAALRPLRSLAQRQYQG